MKTFSQKRIKIISSFIIIVFVIELCSPFVLFASNSPTQAETTAFSPPSTSDLVNPFSGELSYSIPLMEVPGPSGSTFPLTLNYKSTTSPEEDASWVGYGWSLPIGAINRSKRGFPDDVKSTITQYHKSKPVTTVNVGGNAYPEFFDIENVSGSVNGSIRYNTLAGFSYSGGFSLSYMGALNLNLGVDDNGVSFDASLSPTGILNKLVKEYGNGTAEENQKFSKMLNNSIVGKMNWSAQSLGLFGASNPQPRAIQTYNPPYKGTNISGSINIKPDPTPLPASIAFGIFGSYTVNGPEKDFTDLSTYGALFNDDASKDVSAMMDYYQEKTRPFKLKKTRYLTAPFINYDNFSVNAPGLGGSFKAHHKGTGYCGPVSTRSSTSIYNIDPELELGAGIVGAGGTFGAGESVHEEGRARVFSSNEKRRFAPYDYYFRFNNDLGGNIINSPSDYPIRPNANSKGSIPESQLYFRENQDASSPANNFIETSWMSKDRETGKFNKKYSSVPDEASGQIGSYKITNASGQNYVFDLPVYAKNEHSMSYGLPKYSTSQDGMNYFGQGNIEYKYDNETLEMKQGTTYNTPYATSYLLTQILSSDYYDTNGDGPTPNDFGGYVLISYNRTDNENNWYKWRSPFIGLRYSKGEMLNPEDNTGSVSYGVKQIFYTKKIETKTHTAVFITNKSEFSYKDENGNDVTISGTNDEREDCFPANSSEILASRGQNGITPTSTNPSRKLEKIVLFSKSPEGRLKKLKTVFFQYDYQCFPGQKNSRNSVGKLTLTKMWTENDDVYSVPTKPYLFYYSYPTSLPTQLVSGTLLPSSAPNYNIAQYTDRWGYYQENGQAKYQANNHYVNQSASPTDPAPWLLKRIRIPSGADVYVQYEQNDYSYVQDKPAMVMLPLESTSTDDLFIQISNIVNTNQYKIHRSKLNITTDEAASEYLGKLIKQFIVNKERIFFRNNYSITPPGTLSGSSCPFEVSGYCKVESAEYNTGTQEFVLHLGNSNNSSTAIMERGVPKSLAMEYLDNNRHYLNSCNNIEDQPLLAGTFESIVRSVLKFASGPIYSSLLNPIFNPTQSYLRLPVNLKKLGGGVRVKRVLTVYENTSPTVPGETARVFGTEYRYDMIENGQIISSGVATNEPMLGWEENALVNLLPHIDPELEDRVVGGQNKDMYEGPIGESLLPSASIGYRKVVIQNIVNTPSILNIGASVPQPVGFAVNEYLTYKDKPSHRVHISEREEIDKSSKPFFGTNLISTNSIKTSQGYSIIIRNIHGQKKSESRFGGTYSLVDFETKRPVPYESSVYEYYDPEEKVLLMNDIFKPLRYGYLGKEMEMCIETKRSSDVLDNTKVQLTGSITAIPWFFIPTIFPYITLSNDYLEEYVSTNTITYPVLQKSVTTLKNGVQNRVENVAFDSETGQPVITQQADEYDKIAFDPMEPNNKYDGKIINYSLPAHKVYKSMGSKQGNHNLEVDFDQDPRYLDSKLHGRVLGTIDFPTPNKPRLTITHNPTFSDPYYVPLYKRSVAYYFYNMINTGDIIEMPVYKTTGMFGTRKTQKYVVGSINYTHLSTNVFQCDLIDGNSLVGNPPDFDVNLNPQGQMNVSRITVKSGRDNRIHEASYELTTYGSLETPYEEPWECPIGYAKEIEKRQKVCDMLNRWLMDGSGEVNFDDSQPLTWREKISNTLDDLPGSKGIIVGGGNRRYSVKLQRMSNVVKLGYYDYQTNDFITNCGSSPNTSSCIELLPWTGREKFSVNDCGELVYHPRYADHTFGIRISYTFRGQDRTSLQNGQYPTFLTRYNALPTCPNVLKARATVYASNSGSDLNPGQIPTELPEGQKFFQELANSSWKPFISYTYNSPIVRGSYPIAGGTVNNTGWYNYESNNDGKYTPGQIKEFRHLYRFNEPAWDYGVPKKGKSYGLPLTKLYDNCETPNQLNENFVPKQCETPIESTFPYGWQLDKDYYYNRNGDVLLSSNGSGMCEIVRYSHDYSKPSISGKYASIIRNTVDQNRGFKGIFGIDLPDGNGVFEYDNAARVINKTFQYNSFEDAVVSNSKYCGFFGIEDCPDLYPNMVIGNAHTGNRMLQINSNANAIALRQVYFLKSIDRRNTLHNDPIGRIAFWAKTSNTALSLNPSQISFGSSASISFQTPKIIARNGDWYLLESVVTCNSSSTSYILNTDISVINNVPNNVLYIDDIKVQPYESISTCNAYDRNSQRLIATFDDNHFPVIHQYNGNGEAIRTIASTLKGRKTVSEKYMNIARDNTNIAAPIMKIRTDNMDDVHDDMNNIDNQSRKLFNSPIKNATEVKKYNEKAELLNINIDDKGLKIMNGRIIQKNDSLNRKDTVNVKNKK